MNWEAILPWWPVALGVIGVVFDCFFSQYLIYRLVLFFYLVGQLLASITERKALATLEWWLQLFGCRYHKTITFGLNFILVLLILLISANLLAFFHSWMMEDASSTSAARVSSLATVAALSSRNSSSILASPFWGSVLTLFAVLLSIALWLYLRFGCVADARFIDPPDDLWQTSEGRLLPSQKITFREMQDRIALFSLQQEALVLALEGDWGSGKTYVTAALESAHKPREWKIYHRAMGLLSHPIPNWPKAMDIDIVPGLKTPDEQVRDNLWDSESLSPVSNKPRSRWAVFQLFNEVIGKLLDPDDARNYFLYPSERGIGVADRVTTSVLGDELARRRSGGSKRPEKVIFVKTDGWRFTTEAELHWGLLEALLTHPDVPPRFRFLIRTTNLFRYPFVVLPVYVIRACQCIFSRGQVTLPGGAGFTFAMSGMLWQGQLEAAIDKIRDDGGIVVWCLDEIDRSSSEMAQAAITMVRRYLSFPGVITIVPYVKNQLHYKVFNPLQPTRPDLEATIFSVLSADWMQKGFDSPAVASPAEQLGLNPGKIPAATGEGVLSNDFASALETFSMRGLLPRDLESISPELLAVISATEPSGSIQRLLKAHLIRYYLDRNPAEFQELQFLFEEKYLRQAHITLKRMQPADVGAMLRQFDELRLPIERLIRRKLNPQSPGEMNQQMVQTLLGLVERNVTEVITKAHDQLWSPYERPVLRHLVDEVRQKLIGLFHFDRLFEIVALLPRAMIDGRALSLLAAYLDREKNFATIQKELAELDQGTAINRETQGPILNEHATIVMMIVFVVLVAYRRASLRLDPTKAS